jgi:hypothetical protein
MQLDDVDTTKVSASGKSMLQYATWNAFIKSQPSR